MLNSVNYKPLPGYDLVHSCDKQTQYRQSAAGDAYPMQGFRILIVRIKCLQKMTLNF